MEPEQSPVGGLVSRRDLKIAAALVMVLPVAWLVSERKWLPLMHKLAAGLSRLGGESKAISPDSAELIAAGQPLSEVRRDYTARVLEAYAHVLRQHRPGASPPAVRLEGEHHLREALELGRGALLWVATCHSSNLLSKVAVHRAGYRVSHLSHTIHGASSGTWFGRTFLNPIWTRVENRYLRERAVVSEKGQRGPLLLLRRRLSENNPVSFTLTDWGLDVVRVPAGGGCTVRMANGAPRLAQLSAAPLLPVTTVRSGRGFSVIIHPPLEPQGENRKRQVESLLRSMAELVLRFARRHPRSWKTWELIESSDVKK